MDGFGITGTSVRSSGASSFDLCKKVAGMHGNMIPICEITITLCLQRGVRGEVVVLGNGGPLGLEIGGPLALGNDSEPPFGAALRIF